MKPKVFILLMFSFAVLFAVPYSCISAGRTIKLADPVTKGGMPLMEALSKRRSSRNFTDRELPPQVLSNLLWAAYGINRTDSGKRTVPSSMNKQEIELYAATKNGLFRYNAKAHALELVAENDLRALTGEQPYVKNAAVNLIYVADMDRVAGGSEDEKKLYAGADAAFIGQNVYLFCASEGLETVIRAYIDRDKLGAAMKLKKNFRVVLAQSVGYAR